MTKVISLSDKAYREIKSLKLSGESFSDVVIRLSSNAKKRPLSEFFGKWPGSKDEIDSIKKTIEHDRKNFKTREVNF